MRLATVEAAVHPHAFALRHMHAAMSTGKDFFSGNLGAPGGRPVMFARGGAEELAPQPPDTQQESQNNQNRAHGGRTQKAYRAEFSTAPRRFDLCAQSNETGGLAGSGAGLSFCAKSQNPFLLRQWILRLRFAPRRMTVSRAQARQTLWRRRCPNCNLSLQIMNRFL